MNLWRVIWSARNNSPKDGELNGWCESNSSKGWADGQLNGRHETNSPKGWIGKELNVWHKNNSVAKGCIIKWSARK